MTAKIECAECNLFAFFYASKLSSMNLCLNHFTAKDFRVLKLKISHQNELVNNVVVTGVRSTWKRICQTRGGKQIMIFQTHACMPFTLKCL